MGLFHKDDTPSVNETAIRAGRAGRWGLMGAAIGGIGLPLAAAGMVVSGVGLPLAAVLGYGAVQTGALTGSLVATTVAVGAGAGGFAGGMLGAVTADGEISRALKEVKRGELLTQSQAMQGRQALMSQAQQADMQAAAMGIPTQFSPNLPVGLGNPPGGNGGVTIT